MEQATQGADEVELDVKLSLQLVSFGLAGLGDAYLGRVHLLHSQIRRSGSTAVVQLPQLPPQRRGPGWAHSRGRARSLDPCSL